MKIKSTLLLLFATEFIASNAFAYDSFGQPDYMRVVLIAFAGTIGYSINPITLTLASLGAMSGKAITRKIKSYYQDILMGIFIAIFSGLSMSIVNNYNVETGLIVWVQVLSQLIVWSIIGAIVSGLLLILKNTYLKLKNPAQSILEPFSSNSSWFPNLKFFIACMLISTFLSKLVF